MSDNKKRMFVSQNTIANCLQYIKDRLQPQFSASEVRQIQRSIFEKLFNFSTTDLMLKGENRLTESELLLVRDLVKRLLNNEPLQYIMGYTHFCDLKILCDERALIPRPETEELVYKIVELYAHKNEAINVLDLCSGSGCIALGIKFQLPISKVFGVDISLEAISLSKENATKLNLEVQFVQDDVLELNESLDVYQRPWDLMVSNPPYIPESEQTFMANNVLDYEPHLALFVSDSSPIIFYERIALFAKRVLKPNGILAFEIHENLSQEVSRCCSQNGFSNVEIFNDLQGKPRVLIARL